MSLVTLIVIMIIILIIIIIVVIISLYIKRIRNNTQIYFQVVSPKSNQKTNHCCKQLAEFTCEI